MDNEDIYQKLRTLYSAIDNEEEFEKSLMQMVLDKTIFYYHCTYLNLTEKEYMSFLIEVFPSHFGTLYVKKLRKNFSKDGMDFRNL